MAYEYEGEVYLLEDYKINFDLPEPNSQRVKKASIHPKLQTWSAWPVDIKNEEDVILGMQMATWIPKRFTALERRINLSFSNSSEQLENTDNYQAKVDFIELSVRSDYFAKLLQELGQGTKLRLEIRNAQVEAMPRNPWAEPCIAVLTPKQEGNQFCYSATCKFPQRWALYWNTNKNTKYSATVSIIMSCGQVEDSKRIKLEETVQTSLDSETLMHSNKKLLDGKIATDTTIITGEGTRIECHKCFLIGQSSVFGPMLQGNFVEGQTHQIKLDDMSDKGAKAFLDFLYCRDIQVAFDDPKIAVELLLTSHKYATTSLENAMKALLSVKPLEWFDLSSAFELFIFAMKVDSLSHLKEKSLLVMKLKKSELASSEEYKELFEDADKSETAKELCTSLFNM